MNAVVEVPWGRETFGGGDGRAINRHSVRMYVASDSAATEYTLDRTLDGAPPFFTLWEHYVQGHAFIPQLGTCIPVGGENHWGDGWTWAQAEAAAIEAIEDLSRVIA